MTAVRAHGHQRGATCRHPLRLGQNRDDTCDLAQKASKTVGGLRPLKEKPGKTQMRPANRDIKAMKARSRPPTEHTAKFTLSSHCF